MAKKIEDFPSHFWSKCKRSSTCWLWQAAKNKNGYGVIRFRSATAVASRVAYILANGEIPSGLVVRHTCDMPSCINPEHLILGNIADNMRDRKERGRQNNQAKTHCKRGHAFSEFGYNSASQRTCRICRIAIRKASCVRAKESAA